MPDRPAFLLVQPQKGPMHHAARLLAVIIKQPTPETCTLARPAAFPDNPAIETEAFDKKCIVSKVVSQWMFYPMCCALFA
jgi:hypothetical protein